MPTTNPVPSQDPSDLLFNAGKLDEVLNGTGTSFTDRLGTARRTVAGMNADFDAQLADAESDLNVYRADAAASAAEALGYLQTIRATSYGAYAEDPATDPLGNPPTVGDEYFNTTANLLKRWNGTTWQASDINTANLAAPSGSSLIGYQPAGIGAVARTAQDKFREAISVADAGAVGDGVTDDRIAIQAAVDAAGRAGRVLFPQTSSNTYCVSGAIKFHAGQTWIGSGGIDTGGGFGTEIKLTSASTSVVEPADPAPSPVTYGFTAVGFYFNAQSFADCALSLYNTSYALIDQCAAFAGKANAAAILLDSDTNKQCYFNKLNQPRTFAQGTGGVGIRFTRGANANQVFGGKCGSSHRGMEFLSLSAANVIYGTDFEDNSDRHIYIDAPTNKFFGIHMEACPIGFDITANGGNTTRVGTDFASSVTIPVQEAVVNDGSVVDIRPDGGGQTGDLRFGAARFSARKLTAGTTLNYDPLLVSGTSNAIVNAFLNTNTSGAKQWNIYKGDGTNNIAFQVNAATGVVTCEDINQGNTTGTYRLSIRRAAPPATGSYNAGDRVVRTNPSAASPVTEWTCYASGTPGTWSASGWVVLRGPTASRPALGNLDVGVMYFDTTLVGAGKPIWWTGTVWVDATGVSV